MHITDKRTNRVLLWFTDNEYMLLKSNKELTAMSMQSYLRKLIMGEKPLGKPNMEYIKFHRTLQRITLNMMQICIKSTASAGIDKRMLWSIVDNYNNHINKLLELMLSR